MSKATKHNKGIEILSEKVLYSAADCARMCGINRRTWFRLVAAGKTPACVRVGASPKWRRKDLELWIRSDCCSRHEFESRKNAGRN